MTDNFSNNRLSRALAPIEKLPRPLRVWARSKALGNVVKFVGTAGIRVEQLDQSKGVFTLKNRRRVQNHIGGIHAMATGLLLETATGLALGWHLPDGKIPLLKSIHIDYKQIATGNLRAVASLTENQITLMRDEDRGSAVIQVELTDSVGQQPVECQVTWAWVTKKATM